VKLACLLAALAACSPPVRRAPSAGSGSAVVTPRPEVPVDGSVPAEASEEERLAAVQKAMNELHEVAQGCWAAAAVERFDIAGEMSAMIDIGAAGTEAKVTVVSDTVRNPKLAACMTAVLAKYPWAPPLRGQAIQLPFKFRAPDGQNVIDRRLVPWVGQGKVNIATLLDLNNTGNAAVSLVEVAVAPGGSTGVGRQSVRDELWYFLTPAKMRAATPALAAGGAIAEGDVVFVPAGTIREVFSGGAEVRAVLAFVPGGREGTTRAGALPSQDNGVVMGAVFHLPAAAAKSYPRAGGQVKILAEPGTMFGKTQLSASILELPAGTAIPEHVHAKETEVLYVFGGAGTMKVAGLDVPVTATSVVQIPANVKHAFTASAPLRALQIYTPAGPEQRFKTP
jgi:quercetin dioxygenase-like cupin family protein